MNRFSRNLRNMCSNSEDFTCGLSQFCISFRSSKNFCLGCILFGSSCIRKKFRKSREIKLNDYLGNF